MTVEDIAKVCHEANRAYCAALGDHSHLPWEDAPDWQRRSAIDGVRFHLDRPAASPSMSHENWVLKKLADGWRHGPVKDEAKKEHPCIVPFHRLPVEQQYKDALFSHIVAALRLALARHPLPPAEWPPADQGASPAEPSSQAAE